MRVQVLRGRTVPVRLDSRRLRWRSERFFGIRALNEVLMTRTRVPPVLVTGATGRVGRVVVDLLIDAGVPVRALTHRSAAAATLADPIRGAVAGRVSRRDGGKLAAPGRGHAARRVGRNDWQAGVHHLDGVRPPRIGATIVSPVGRRSRHRVQGRSNPIELTFACARSRNQCSADHASRLQRWSGQEATAARRTQPRLRRRLGISDGRRPPIRAW